MSRLHSIRGKILLAGALAVSAVAVACNEDLPTSPSASNRPSAGDDRQSIVAALVCNADVAAGSVECDAPAGATQKKGPEGVNSIIIGGQDVFVAVKSSNVNYNAGTGAFTFDVTIRNLIPQPMGTADTTGALAPHPAGIRIFFASGPTVTGGSGIITVTADGDSTFTGASQPYYQYNTVLEQFEISAPKTWQLNMPPTVTTFSFLLLVSAAVPRENGYIDLQVSQPLAPPTDRQVTAVVRNANGTINTSAGPITWSSLDTTRATVDANGLINPLRAGQTTIVAQSGSSFGKLVVTVRPIRRYWRGTLNTAWENGGNWAPDAIKPEPTDTAVVADSIATAVFPVLSANESIGGVEVEDLTAGGTIPMISLGAFNLTASGDVCTNSGPCAGGVVFGSANINSTVGQLLLTGTARTIRGLVPRINVLGTYSLSGNLTVSQRIRVQSGRLRNTGFRIRQNP